MEKCNDSLKGLSDSNLIDKKQVIQTLEEIAVLLDLKGENPFKVRAYSNAARILQGVPQNISRIVQDGDTVHIKGIGKGIGEVISELVSKGRSSELEALKSSIPPGLLEILRIQGMGPKRTKALWDKLGITNIGELEYACNENRLVDLEGFGKKTQEKILIGIEMLKRYSERHLLSEAMDEAEMLFDQVRGFPGIIQGEIAGSIRRWKETIKDIDILVSAKDRDRERVMDMFTALSQVAVVIAKGDTKSSVSLKSGINADLRVVNDEQFPYALHHFTGSKEHNVAMRGYAKKLGIKMNEYGLFKGDEENIPCRGEEDIFNKLGMQYIPPELREDYGEIEAAQQNKLPVLVNKGDLRGIIHVHSHYSDGTDTLMELAEASQRYGFSYLVITDHSKFASYANGLTQERVSEQHEEIERINGKLKGFCILKGIECDILADGSLDYDDTVLASFDLVIASVHYKLSMTQEDATERILTAMQNPYVTILGHPTGRLLLAREGYPLNMNRVIETAAQRGVALELNANPHRLDIDWRVLQEARKQGVKISINPDAHRLGGLQDIRYGLGIARKGWLTKGDVLNCLSADELVQFARARHTAK